MAPEEVLPLFVYGTLRPGAEAWEVAATWVVRTAPAVARGRLVPAGLPYPTAIFDAAGGPLPGNLLWLDPGRFSEAMREMDDFEDVPDLFERVVVEVEAEGRSLRAYAYRWRG